MKMKYFSILLTLFLFMAMGPTASADVSPGDVINTSNYQSIEGMVPDSVLNWVKEGKVVINVGKLNYSPLEFVKSDMGDLFSINKGKYVLKEAEIVDAKTGQLALDVIGYPFPGFDPKGPDAALKFMYNRYYMQASWGNLEIPTWQLQFINETRGLIREAEASYYQYNIDGNPRMTGEPNSQNLQRHQVFKFHSPFDIAGTAQMSTRFIAAAQQDLLFGFLPSIRRVRRLTPSNRSDPILGGDVVYDDAWGYDGKLSAFGWKMIAVKELLLPYHSEDPQLFEILGEGKYKTDTNMKDMKFGFQDPSWTGAKWAPLNAVWVKRPGYVIESKSKDPYYNYGSVNIWVDAETGMAMIKVIYDRSGKYWKSFLLGGCDFITADGKKKRVIQSGLQMGIDDRSKRATNIRAMAPGNPWTQGGEIDSSIFSLGGFAKFCK
jgi:hypothetical protein